MILVVSGNEVCGEVHSSLTVCTELSIFWASLPARSAPLPGPMSLALAQNVELSCAELAQSLCSPLHLSTP